MAKGSLKDGDLELSMSKLTLDDKKRPKTGVDTKKKDQEEKKGDKCGKTTGNVEGEEVNDEVQNEDNNDDSEGEQADLEEKGELKDYREDDKDVPSGEEDQSDDEEDQSDDEEDQSDDEEDQSDDEEDQSNDEDQIHADIKILFMNSDKADRKEQIIALLRDHADATLLLITEATIPNTGEVRQRMKDEYNANWEGFKGSSNVDKGERFVVYYNADRVHIPYSGVNFNQIGRYISLEFDIQSHATLEVWSVIVLVVHMPRQEHFKQYPNRKAAAWTALRGAWDGFRNIPTTVIGDFNETPTNIHNKLRNGTCAFIGQEMPTNSAHRYRCVDNAYYTNRLQLVQKLAFPVEGLTHPIGLVAYNIN